MRLAIMDCESDGLLEQLTKIHCLALRNYVTDEALSFADQPGHRPIEEGLEILSKAEKIFAHNGIAHDIPALQKVYPGWTYSGYVFDTLVAARTRWAHIKELDFPLFRRGKIPGELIGTHKLEAWGYRLGFYKKHTGITDWSKWTPEIHERCIGDTAIPRRLLMKLKAEGYSEQATAAEMELAWILAAMERGGWPFDIEKAQQLQAMLAGKREQTAQKLRKTFGQFYKKNGPTTSPKKDRRVCIGTELDAKGKERKVMTTTFYEGAEYQPLKLVDFNPGSRHHIGDRLTKLYGWEPTEFGEDGKPTIDDGILKGLPYPPIPDLCEYLLLDKRLGQLSEGKEAWLKCATKDRPEGGAITGMHHIHGYINAGGTVTHRASHSHPNVAQVPKVKKPWGTECRGLFTVPPGWSLVGADMSGLELRCLAHYMARWDDMAYGRIILNGKKEDKTDIHTTNQRTLGLPDEPAEGRDTSGYDTGKTWFYAYLYGAGDEKLGSIVAPTLSAEAQKERGRADRKRFEGGLPALGYLIDSLKEKLAKTRKASRDNIGYIKLIDGRKAFVRHDHAILNTLLQGTGGVICKHWKVESARRIISAIGPMGWDKQWSRCGWIHDEVQDGSRPEHADMIARVHIESAEAMTQKFSFRCPLTGEAKVGRDWASTH